MSKITTFIILNKYQIFNVMNYFNRHLVLKMTLIIITKCFIMNMQINFEYVLNLIITVGKHYLTNRICLIDRTNKIFIKPILHKMHIFY